MKVASKKKVLALEQKVLSLEKTVAELLRLNDRWVSNEEAMELTGLSENSLKKERERIGTLLVFQKGKRKLQFSYNSIVAYNEDRAVNGKYKPQMVAA